MAVIGLKGMAAGIGHSVFLSIVTHKDLYLTNIEIDLVLINHAHKHQLANENLHFVSSPPNPMAFATNILWQQEYS